MLTHPILDQLSELRLIGMHKALGELTGRKVKFPGDYDAKAAAKLRTAWD